MDQQNVDEQRLGVLAGTTIKFVNGPVVRVESVGKPLTSGRFVGKHVAVYTDLATGREGTFIIELGRFVKVV